MSFVIERFALDASFVEGLRRRQPDFGFNGMGEVVFHRTYSRRMEGGGQEGWADVCVRVIEGALSIGKDVARKQGLAWDELDWQELGQQMAEAMFEMKWLPPGRGLWAQGTEYVRERGSAALFNCAFVDVRGRREDGTRSTVSGDMDWICDMLMSGVGVGFSAQETGLVLFHPTGPARTYVVPDTREGWAESVKVLIESYENGSSPVIFDYREIRPAGSPIKGFGGTASGSAPLAELHVRIREFCDSYLLYLDNQYPEYTETRLVADIANSIGKCVVAGNVRRSAMICLGSTHDDVFVDLKNWERFPERSGWMHLSNNSVRLADHGDFLKLPEIADGIKRNGEPGFLNMVNIREYGRFGDRAGTEIMPGYILPVDRAIGCNPCGEIPLESYETCCLSEVFPTRCADGADFLRACRYATIYATFVQWLPTHRPETNAVNRRNGRIGVSISGIFDWYERDGMAEITRAMRDGYKVVRQTNADLADGFGMRRAIRVTTVKPSGSISKLVGCSAGVHAPEYETYLRRVRVSRDWEGRKALDAAGYRHEPDVNYPDSTEIYEFPIRTSHAWRVRPVNEVSIYEQAMLMMAVQRHWADNMVSATLKFQPGDDIEKLLGLIAGNVKSVSMLPIFDPMVTDEAGNKKAAYPQMPEEPITEAEFAVRFAELGPIDWTGYAGDGEDERFCATDACEVDLEALKAAKAAAGD